MSLTVSATPSLIELYEDKKRRIQEWISHTPAPSSGGLVDAFTPPSTTPSLASLDEEVDSEKEEHSQQHFEDKAGSVSSSDTFVHVDQPQEPSHIFPQYSRQLPQLPGLSAQHLYSPPLPISTPAPFKSIPISLAPNQLELASLGPLKQRQLAKPLHLPMATHAYHTHRSQHHPIVIDSPRRHGFHRHHNHDDHEREYDRRGHRHHHHRHRSPSPVRSRARSRSGTRARSQPARAHHIEETPQFSNSHSRGIGDDENIVVPADYHPVSGSGGEHRSDRRGRTERGEGRVGRMMDRMGMATSRSRPQGHGGPAEGQPGPINPNAGHQPNPSQTSPTNLYQNIGQLAGAAVEQYVQGKLHREHGHAHHPSHSHHHGRGRRSPSRQGERSTHNVGRTRHRSASVAQSYSQPVQQAYTLPTAARPVYTRRRSKSVDERDLGGYRSRYANPMSSPVQQVIQSTNQPMLVPINRGRGGWAVVPPVGQEIRVVGSPTTQSVVPAVNTHTVLHHSSGPKSKHRRSRSDQPTEGRGFFRKLFGIGKNNSKSSNSHHHHFGQREMEVHHVPVQYVDPGRHDQGRLKDVDRKKEKNGRDKRRRESY